MLRVTLAIAVFSITALTAQESTSAIPRNEKALQNAIAGIGKKSIRPGPQLVRMAAPAPRACSVALQAMPIENPEQFAIQRMPAQDVEKMPNVAVPAPPCEAGPR
jgi:hypothetical protein